MDRRVETLENLNTSNAYAAPRQWKITARHSVLQRERSAATDRLDATERAAAIRRRGRASNSRVKNQDAINPSPFLRHGSVPHVAATSWIISVGQDATSQQKSSNPYGKNTQPNHKEKHGWNLRMPVPPAFSRTRSFQSAAHNTFKVMVPHLTRSTSCHLKCLAPKEFLCQL